MIRLMTAYAAVLLISGCATGAQSKDMTAPMNDTVTGFINKSVEVDGQVCRYVVYVPYEYTRDEAWPLIVFLHGAGERGSDGLVQTEVGIGTAIRRHPDWYKAVVLMPQCPEDQLWNMATPQVEAALQRTLHEYRIDETRLYLTGLSMGGYGTWIWGAVEADRFAALMPICGGGRMEDLQMLADKDLPDAAVPFDERISRLATVPIWAFHGAEDTVVPPESSRQMVERVKQAGGDVHYTEFKDTGHDSWNQAYAHEEAIRWLFNQRKTK